LRQDPSYGAGDPAAAAGLGEIVGVGVTVGVGEVVALGEGVTVAVAEGETPIDGDGVADELTLGATDGVETAPARCSSNGF
jgi:hypothetical protein